MKEQLRKEILEKKKELSSDDIISKSNSVTERLVSLEEFQKAKNVLFYVSFNHEVNTHTLIKKVLGEKNVLVPFVEEGNDILQVSKINSFDDLEKGSFGILEPKKDTIKKIAVEEIDLVLVPANVFDRKGHRIGYGHGFYDRFFHSLNHEPFKVGLCYDFQLVDNIEEDLHDVSVDVVVTDKESIRTSNKD